MRDRVEIRCTPDVAALIDALVDLEGDSTRSSMIRRLVLVRARQWQNTSGKVRALLKKSMEES